MNQWQQAWRHIIAPLLPEKGLRALADEIKSGGHRLIPGRFLRNSETADDDHNAPPTCGCAIGFAVWQDDVTQTLGQAEETVTQLMMRAATMSGASSPCLVTFTTFFDDGMHAHRHRTLTMLWPEVERAWVTQMMGGLLDDEWWETPNPAFDGWTPWNELVTFGPGRLESMVWQIADNVAN